jgi:hypothetical protein
LVGYRTLRERLDKHREPEEKPKPNNSDPGKVIEGIVDYLRNHLNPDGVPLSYVVRESDTATEGEHSDFNNVFEEMELRATLSGPVYDADNHEVFRMLLAIFTDHHNLVYISKHKKKQDGRAAFKSLKLKICGSNYTVTQATKLEADVRALIWTKDTASWSLDKCINKLVGIHADMKKLTEYGYSMRDKASCVRDLLEVIRPCQQMDAVRSLIRSDPNLQSDFDRCMDLVLNTYNQDIKNNNRLRQAHIAAVGGNMSNLDPTDITRYYAEKEWDRLTADERTTVLEERAKHGISGNKNKSKKGWKGNNKKGGGNKQQGGGKGKFISRAAHKRQVKKIKKLEAQLAELKVSGAEPMDTDEGNSSTGTTNRNFSSIESPGPTMIKRCRDGISDSDGDDKMLYL